LVETWCLLVVKGTRKIIPQARAWKNALVQPLTEILRFVEEHRALHGHVGARRLVPLIEERFGVRIHPRGLEKALGRVQKKLPEAGT